MYSALFFNFMHIDNVIYGALYFMIIIKPRRMKLREKLLPFNFTFSFFNQPVVQIGTSKSNSNSHFLSFSSKVQLRKSKWKKVLQVLENIDLFPIIMTTYIIFTKISLHGQPLYILQHMKTHLIIIGKEILKLYCSLRCRRRTSASAGRNHRLTCSK